MHSPDALQLELYKESMKQSNVTAARILNTLGHLCENVSLYITM